MTTMWSKIKYVSKSEVSRKNVANATHCITKAILRSSRSSLNFLPSSYKDLIYQKVVGGSPATRSKEAKATAAV